MNSFKKRFLAYVNKEGFDHTQGAVDPDTFHTSFIFFARLFNVMDDDFKPWWIYVSPVGVATSAFLALILVTYSFVHHISKFTRFDVITECGTYLLIMIYKSIIVSSCFLNRESYHALLRSLRSDFEYINTRGSKYSKEFFENQKLTFKACVLSGLFTGTMGGGMVVSALLALAYVLITSDGDQIRPLPFPFVMYKIDETATPYFEIMFIVCVWLTFTHTYVYIFMIQTQVLWVRTITCKADVIVWNLHDLLSDVKPAKNKAEAEYYELILQKRLREIVKMHHSMLELMKHHAKVLRKCLLCEQKITSPIICTTAFCSAEKLESGEIPLILMFLCTAVIVLAYIPSYLCTTYAEKVESVGLAWTNIPFWNAGPVIRPYAVLMIQRSLRPLPIQAAGFDEISLKTYANTLSRAYQWFNMLRQSNLNID